MVAWLQVSAYPGQSRRPAMRGRIFCYGSAVDGGHQDVAGGEREQQAGGTAHGGRALFGGNGAEDAGEDGQRRSVPRALCTGMRVFV